MVAEKTAKTQTKKDHTAASKRKRIETTRTKLVDAVHTSDAAEAEIYTKHGGDPAELKR